MQLSAGLRHLLAHRALAVVATLATFALPLGGRLFAQLPTTRVFAIFPIGGKQGTTVEVTITGGADLEGVNRLFFTHPGITAVQKTQKVDGKDQPQPVANQFVVTIAADVPPGVYDLHAAGTYGVSNPRAFVVSDGAEMNETEPNNTVAQATAVPVNTVVNARADGGADVDYYKVKLAAGQRLIVDCWAQRIDSRMDPILVLYAPTGKELAFSDNFNHRDSLLDYTAPVDGEYLVEIRDQLYNGSAEYVYRLSVGTGPYIDCVIPPAGLPGTMQEFTLLGRNLAGGTPAEGLAIEGRALERLTVKIDIPGDPVEAQRYRTSTLVQPEDSVVDGFEYRLKTETGSSNPVPIFFATAPVAVEVEPNNEPAQAQRVTAPCEFAGQFQQRGDQDFVAFEVKKGQVFWIELLSQRLGTPAEPVMIVQMVTTAQDGKEQVSELTVQDDNGSNIGGLSYNTATDDPSPYRLTAPADGVCRVLLRDTTRDTRGDARFVYRLSIRAEKPDFRVVAVPEFPIPQERNNPSPWALQVRKGGTASMEVYAFRMDGFGGEIEVSVEGLPEGVTCPGAVIGPGQNAAPLVFSAAEGAAEWVGALRLVGKAKVGEQEVVREVRGGTVLWSVQQGTPAESRMARAVYLAVGQPAPFLVQADRGPRVRVAQGHELYLPVKVTRRGDFKQPVAMTAVRIPGNVQNENVNVAAEQGEVTLHLFVNNNAPVGTYTFYLQATAQVPFTKNADGSNKQNVAVIDPSTPIILTITPGPVTLAVSVPNNGQVKRGAKLEIPVKVERRNNFKGPVTLELVLPRGVAGVKAEPVTVPADQNQGTFVVEAAGDATVGNHGFVNLRAKMEFGGEQVEVDQPIALNVQQ